MRRVQVQVRRGRLGRVLDLAREHGASSPVAWDAAAGEGEEWSVLVADLPNHRVGDFVARVEEAAGEARFAFAPRGVIVLGTPLAEVRTALREVERRSTLELVVSSLQSVGSWRGMLLYAFFSGVVAAYGVIFDVAYLLVAAMLIAPMGAPAMVSAVGTAMGDPWMVGRGAARFAAAIGVLVGAAALLGLAYGLSQSTPLLEKVTSLSRWGVAVALVAGAAGAQSQVESSRASLVTGTATGFLVAAALSPTSAVLGLSLVLRRWDYTGLMAFQLALQYAAIVTGGWLALRLYGVRPSDPSAGRGSARGRAAVASLLGAALLALVLWQAAQGVRFRKADSSVEIEELAREALRSLPRARLLDATAAFTRPDLAGPRESALIRVVVEDLSDPASPAELEAAVRGAVVRRLRAEMPEVVPFVTVTVVPGGMP